MAYAKKKKAKKSSYRTRSSYSRNSYRKSGTKRTSGRKRTFRRRAAPQTVRIVLEQVAPQSETQFLTGTPKTVVPKKARF